MSPGGDDRQAGHQGERRGLRFFSAQQMECLSGEAHHWLIDREETHREGPYVVGAWFGVCKKCGQSGSGPIRVRVVIPRHVLQPLRTDMYQKYKDWLAEAEDGSFVDDL